jgi:hypothetical protein
MSTAARGQYPWANSKGDPIRSDIVRVLGCFTIVAGSASSNVVAELESVTPAPTVLRLHAVGQPLWVHFANDAIAVPTAETYTPNTLYLAAGEIRLVTIGEAKRLATIRAGSTDGLLIVEVLMRWQDSVPDHKRQQS